MDIWIRWILLVISLLFVALIVWDFFQQRKRSVTEALLSKTNLDDEQTTPDVLLDLMRANIASQDKQEPESLSTVSESVDDTTTSDEVGEPVVIKAPTSATEASNSDNNYPRFISISVVSRESNGIVGSDLINELTSAYLFHGKMNLFHRFENKDGTGEVLFSVASATEPGYFEISDMNENSFYGITLFFDPRSVNNAALALDTLVKVSKQLAFRLNGQLLDIEHQPLNKSKLEEYKDRILAASNQ